MGIFQKQKKILAAFAAFMLFMFLCTLISRAVYASKLPQVTVDTPRRMALDHVVNVEGTVRQGREYAVTALAGLRVRTVYANVGDRVEPGTLLFDLDMEDLQKKVQEKELEIKKQKLQIAASDQNRGLDAQKRQTDSARAEEDRARAEQKTGEELARAKEDLEDAKNACDAHIDSPVEVTSEEKRKAARAAYKKWNTKKKELSKAAEQARAVYEAAQEEVKRLEEAAQDGADVPEELKTAVQAEEKAKADYDAAEAAYEAHMANPVKKPDYSAEDAAKAAWEEKKSSLEDAVEASSRALQDAERSRSDALLEAGRKAADSKLPADADSTLEVSRLELASLETELAAYKKVQDGGGQVYPETEGIITRIQVSPGERVGDGAAVVYADVASPMQFQASLTKEQKKYVNQGDLADIKLGGSSGTGLSIDYVAENDVNPELYDARVFLPDGAGTLGQSGSLEVRAQSETFSCCIPLEALREDSNQRNFVYVVSERAGILGKELTAEKLYVKVLDKNDRYAAVEEGVIDRDSELIVSSTEEFDERDVIRYKE